ncbi:MAG: phospholipase D family protein [Nitrospirae bacterium]|nr:phospholipase D family protein [Nitrospirota bacterium]
MLDELRSATEVRLAVAYFNPDEDLLTALANCPRLTLVISEEFTINDPYKLERLLGTATVRSVPPYCEQGKLHAKVMVVTRADSRLWVLVGSANMTWQGLFSNQEACLALDSEDAADRVLIHQITDWFALLLASARVPNLDQAKQVFDTRSLYRLERRSALAQAAIPTARYWALKTTSGDTGEDHWHSFLAESVVAVGWPNIAVNPANVTSMQLQDAINAAYPDEGDPSGAARKIQKFVGLGIGDIVLICRGYPPNSTKPVHIYGFARVTGSFRDDLSSSWRWRFKRDAVIQVIDMFLSKEVVADALGKGSLRGAIHDLDRSEFERLANKLGVPLAV